MQGKILSLLFLGKFGCCLGLALVRDFWFALLDFWLECGLRLARIFSVVVTILGSGASKTLRENELVENEKN